MNSVWVLTSEYNDYDQHGEYFEKVFRNKPTAKELSDFLGSYAGSKVIDNLLTKGGGRIEWEYQWWYLKEIKL